MKVLIVLVVMVGFLYGIESKTLVTENEMLNESEDGIAADIDKMPAEGFEETENQLQQAPLDEEEPTDEADEAEQEDEVTANGCVTAKVCGTFYKPKQCRVRECFTVRVAATKVVYKTRCKNHKFNYGGHKCQKRQCFKVQVGIKVVYVSKRKCWRYKRFCGFKCFQKCKTVTFRYPPPSAAEVARD